MLEDDIDEEALRQLNSAPEAVWDTELKIWRGDDGKTAKRKSPRPMTENERSFLLNALRVAREVYLNDVRAVRSVVGVRLEEQFQKQADEYQRLQELIENGEI